MNCVPLLFRGKCRKMIFPKEKILSFYKGFLMKLHFLNLFHMYTCVYACILEFRLIFSSLELYLSEKLKKNYRYF